MRLFYDSKIYLIYLEKPGKIPGFFSKFSNNGTAAADFGQEGGRFKKNEPQDKNLVRSHKIHQSQISFFIFFRKVRNPSYVL